MVGCGREDGGTQVVLELCEFDGVAGVEGEVWVTGEGEMAEWG